MYMINKRLKRGHYQSLAALVQDLLLMVDNACSYNIEESEIYVAAVRLGQLTLETARALDPDFRPPKKRPYLIAIKNEASIQSTIDAVVENGGMCNGVCNGIGAIGGRKPTIVKRRKLVRTSGTPTTVVIVPKMELGTADMPKPKVCLKPGP